MTKAKHDFQPAMKFLIGTLVVLTAAYIGYGLLLYFKQRSFIYFPTPPFSHSYQEVVYDTGESIRVIIVNAGHDEAILYFGGNAEPAAMSAGEFEMNYPDRTAYLVNYRGYGGSTGSPTEEGLYRDALSIFDQVARQHDTVSVIGRSLGSGIATFLASERSVHRLVLITPLDSAAAVARTFFPIYPVTLLVKDIYDSVGRAPHINTRTLVLIAANDRVIPPRHARNLVDAFRAGIVESHTLTGAGHNDISLHPEYQGLIDAFLAAKTR